MKQRLYSIYDTKLQAYFSPFVSQNDEVAKRNFKSLANDTNSRISEHPADYQLINIGLWSDETGELQPQDHKNLGFASEYTEDGGT